MTDLRERISAELTILDFRGFEISAALRVALGDVIYALAKTHGNERAQDSQARAILKTKLDRSFRLTYDLVAHLAEEAFQLDLPNLPSNRISGQFWCIVGARESYLQAIEMGGWQGFSCSLSTPQVKEAVVIALEHTYRRLCAIDFTTLTDAQLDLAFDLLEHEIQHHGQLIRFVYANRLTFPLSWTERYTV